MRRSRLIRAVFMICAVVMTAAVSGCGAYYPPHMRPLSADMRALMANKGMTPEQPILVRVFKAEAQLEVWKQKDDGHYYHLKTYKICKFSGELGPKQKQGDMQAPEGFYLVSKKQLNPKSHYHLSFNIGYPNTFDRAQSRTGANLMVHGDCKSRGCYAMTDNVMEEIYALVVAALDGGQEQFQVHAFPFRMTNANLAAHTKSKWFDFWVNLKEGYDYFEVTRLEPSFAVCGKQYIINADFSNGTVPNSKRACPRYSKKPVVAYRSKRYSRPRAPGELSKPLASVMDLRFGEIEPVFQVMTLGPATPDLKAKPQKQAAKGAQKKVAQRGSFQD